MLSILQFFDLGGGGPVPQDEAPPTFACTWCNHEFGTKRGLGVHSRAAHPAEFYEANVPVRVKARWMEAEAHLLAMQEAAMLAKNPGVKNINQHLLRVFPQRPLEAIK